MRPVRLEIEGLRSFRNRQEIDFTGRDYIAVIGDTGAGKSSMLEALTFALFGRPTFSGRGHQDELMNASSTTLRVVFAFDVRDERWEVSRTLKRSGAGEVRPGPVTLRRLGDDGEPIETVSGAREVNGRVEKLIGLDVDAFLRTVVLPQGQFSRLLVDDDQKLRAGVLRQIWRTDDLTDAGKLAADALTELGPLRGRVEQALADEPEDPNAQLLELEAAVGRCTAASQTAKTRHGEANNAAKALEEMRQLIERIAKVTLSLKQWDGPSVVQQAAELAQAAVQAARHIEEAEKGEKAARSAIAAIPADDDGLTLTEATEASTSLKALPSLAIQRDSAQADVKRIEGELEGLDQQQANKAKAEVDATDAMDRLESRQKEIAETVRVAEDRLSTARTAVENWRRARDGIVEAEREHREAKLAVAEIEQVLEKAEKASTAAVARHAQDASALALAQREEAAAEAAHGLHAGDPCPVCDRELPAVWTPPTAPALDAARDSLEKARATLERAKAEVGRQQGLLQGAQRSLSKTNETLAYSRETADAAFSKLKERLGAPPSPDASDEELLTDLTKATESARSALNAHAGTIEDARAAQNSAIQKHAAARSTRKAKEDELAGARERREEAASNFNDQLGQLPEPFRPTGDDLKAEVSELLATLEERRQILEKRAEARERHRKELDDYMTRRQQLEQERKKEVDEPAERLWNTLLDHRSLLNRAADDLNAPVTLPTVDARPLIGDFEGVIGALSRATEELARLATNATTNTAAELEAAGKVISTAASSLGLDGRDVATVLATTETIASEAALDLRQATSAADRFRNRMPVIEALRSAGAELNERYLALSDLSAALRDGAFPKWLTIRRSRNLLVHASRLLAEMTADRYAFADLDDEVEQWAVFDSDNGQPRSPSSLSGGEKFVASLALALGMVEMMGRQGDRIESLFLDEGFGALDRTNLDAAVEALASVAATGRTVTVITHLRAVAEQIENVLSVTAEPTGSRVMWLDQTERSAIAESDLSAPSGLLE